MLANEVLTFEDIAERLSPGISRQAVYKWTYRGVVVRTRDARGKVRRRVVKLRTIRLPGGLRVTHESLRTFLKALQESDLQVDGVFQQQAETVEQGNPLDELVG